MEGPDRSPLDEVADLGMAKVPRFYLPVFYHVTLPNTQAMRLFRFLTQEGVTAARLFPGFKGVTQAMEERMRYLFAEIPGIADA